MRELVIDKIVEQFKDGLDELIMAFVDCSPGNKWKLYEDFCEEHEDEINKIYLGNKPPYPEDLIKAVYDKFGNRLLGLLYHCPNETLLKCLDGQALQRWRKHFEG